MSLKSFKKLLEKAQQTDSYWVEAAKLQFAIELNRLFRRKGSTQKELAEKVGTSPAYITKVFRGDSNFTIETMVKLARAVDGDLEINIVPRQNQEKWLSILQAQQPSNAEQARAWIETIRHPHEKIPTSA